MAREYLETETEMTYMYRCIQELSERLGVAEEQEQQAEQLRREKVGGKYCLALTCRASTGIYKRAIVPRRLVRRRGDAPTDQVVITHPDLQSQLLHMPIILYMLQESLQQLQMNLSRQLELLQRDGPDGWVVMQRQGSRHHVANS